MDDLGHQISYLVLKRGTPVYGPDGERLGRVVKVLHVPVKSVFDGIVVETPKGRRFADGPDVAEIHERGVILVHGAEGLVPAPGPVMRRARRMWDLLSGNY